MAVEPDYYAILGVSPDSEDIVINAAYRALVLRYHPDKNSSAQAARKTAEINGAFAILRDPAARAAYDQRRKVGKQQGGSGGSPPPPPPNGGPSTQPRSDPPLAADAKSARGGLIFASILTLSVIGIAILGSLSAPTDTNANVMNVDENLTTTDMNAVADMSATDLNASEANTMDSNIFESNSVDAGAGESQLADLSRQPQTTLSYSTVEDGADNAARLIMTKGIAGARAYSERCHQVVQNKPSWDGADNCAAFDYAAAYIDNAVSTQAGWPKNGYFDFQSENQPDVYSGIGAPSYVTGDRLRKIRAAAQDAASEAVNSEIARRHRSDASSSPASPTTPDNSAE